MADELTDHPNQVRRLFETPAVTWPKGYVPEGRLTGRLALLATVLDFYTARRSHLPDLGCGNYEMARPMAATGFRVTACDISENMLRTAPSTRCADAAKWVCLDPHWRKLPFPSKSFEAIVASSLFEYVPRTALNWRDAVRYPRPKAVHPPVSPASQAR